MPRPMRPDEFVQLTPEQVSQLIDSGVILNEHGADMMTRWLVKWFHTRPEDTKAFLESRGFDVLPTDRKGKIQFAIRQRDLTSLIGENKNPWKVLDPDGFDRGDMVDLAFDVFAGYVTAQTTMMGAASGAALGGGGGTAASPGGGTVAGAVGGGALGAGLGSAFGAAGMEATRQTLGNVAGVNTGMDVGAIAKAGTFGLIAPGIGDRIAKFAGPLSTAGKATTRKVAAIARAMGGKLGGVSAEDLAAATADPGTIYHSILRKQTPDEIALLDKFRGFVGRMKLPENRFQENVEIDGILAKGAGQVPMKGTFDVLMQRGYKPVGDQRDGLNKLRQIAKDIAEKIGAKDVAGASKMKVGPKLAQELQDDIQGQVDFKGLPGEGFANKVLKKAQAGLGRNVAASIKHPAARERYTLLNGRQSTVDPASDMYIQGTGVSGKTQALNELRKKVGPHAQSGAAEHFFARVTGEGRTQELRLVQQLDRLFGTDFVKQGTLARLGTKFSGEAPRLTATGQFLGGGIGTGTVGAGLGYLAAGPGGALVGGGIGKVLGTLAATPRGVLRVGRAVTKLESGVPRITGKAVTKARRIMVGAAPAASRMIRPVDRVDFEPDKARPKPEQDAMKMIVGEVNALPGMTFQQRVDEIERRAMKLSAGAPK